VLDFRIAKEQLKKNAPEKMRLKMERENAKARAQKHEAEELQQKEAAAQQAEEDALHAEVEASKRVAAEQDMLKEAKVAAKNRCEEQKKKNESRMRMDQQDQEAKLEAKKKATAEAAKLKAEKALTTEAKLKASEVKLKGEAEAKRKASMEAEVAMELKAKKAAEEQKAQALLTSRMKRLAVDEKKEKKAAEADAKKAKAEKAQLEAEKKAAAVKGEAALFISSAAADVMTPRSARDKREESLFDAAKDEEAKQKKIDDALRAEAAAKKRVAEEMQAAEEKAAEEARQALEKKEERAVRDAKLLGKSKLLLNMEDDEKKAASAMIQREANAKKVNEQKEDKFTMHGLEVWGATRKSDQEKSSVTKQVQKAAVMEDNELSQRSLDLWVNTAPRKRPEAVPKLIGGPFAGTEAKAAAEGRKQATIQKQEEQMRMEAEAEAEAATDAAAAAKEVREQEIQARAAAMAVKQAAISAAGVEAQAIAQAEAKAAAEVRAVELALKQAALAAAAAEAEAIAEAEVKAADAAQKELERLQDQEGLVQRARTKQQEEAAAEEAEIAARIEEEDEEMRKLEEALEQSKALSLASKNRRMSVGSSQACVAAAMDLLKTPERWTEDKPVSEKSKADEALIDSIRSAALPEHLRAQVKELRQVNPPPSRNLHPLLNPLLLSQAYALKKAQHYEEAGKVEARIMGVEEGFELMQLWTCFGMLKADGSFKTRLSLEEVAFQMGSCGSKSGLDTVYNVEKISEVLQNLVVTQGGTEVQEKTMDFEQFAATVMHVASSLKAII
jgi:hypothetical protein